MMDAVRREISGVLERGKIPVMLGGEHSISIGAVQAMKEARPGISVLHLDAHADMRESYQGRRSAMPAWHAGFRRRRPSFRRGYGA
jgi:agmatinase